MRRIGWFIICGAMSVAVVENLRYQIEQESILTRVSSAIEGVGRCRLEIADHLNKLRTGASNSTDPIHRTCRAEIRILGDATKRLERLDGHDALVDAVGLLRSQYDGRHDALIDLCSRNAVTRNAIRSLSVALAREPSLELARVVAAYQGAYVDRSVSIDRVNVSLITAIDSLPEQLRAHTRVLSEHLPELLERSESLDDGAIQAALGEADSLVASAQRTHRVRRIRAVVLLLCVCGALVAATGALGLRLRRNARRVAILNDSLERRVRERTEALSLARKRAESADKAKGAFLANMSHEIRTPMTAILGYAELLHAEQIGREESREYLNVIRKSGHHLLNVINDVLDISKIEAGHMTLEKVDVDPGELMKEVHELMLAKAREEEVGLLLEVTDLPGCVGTDPTRLRQAIINLVGNAIKFTERGDVYLRARMVSGAAGGEGDELLEVQVEDEGIGMTAEQVEKLFQPFSQADESTTRKFGGTGLGLSISQHVANAMGGRIEVESRVGEGSRFTMTVPVSAGEGRASRAGAGDVETVAPRELDCSVLVVEDNPVNQRLVERILRNAGAKVSTADNGREAVDVALRSRDADRSFDVILMDMQMPVLDGFAATRELRDRGWSLPIVALTAHALVEEGERCLAAGCDDFASKPVDRDTLLRTVSRHAECSRLG